MLPMPLTTALSTGSMPKARSAFRPSTQMTGTKTGDQMLHLK
jgi:hypothetical protein